MAELAELDRQELDVAGNRRLVLDGQRCVTWCENGPENLRLVTSEGFVRPRCKRRDCGRCWALRSRELARCLVLDARVETPSVCLTLTTATPWQELDPVTYRRGSGSVFKRLRRRYGRVDYFGAIEFTTGRAKRSGGHRRLHGHYLVKGLDPATVLDVEELVRETWREVTGAWVVEAAALVAPGAALGYLGLHHRKASQAPPSSWRGMTERASKSYWHRPIAELRAEARAELAAEAHAHRTGLSIELARLDVVAREPARLIEVRTRPGSSVLEPLGEVHRPCALTS